MFDWFHNFNKTGQIQSNKAHGGKLFLFGINPVHTGHCPVDSDICMVNWFLISSEL